MALATLKRILGRWFSALYLWVCVGLWAAYFYFGFFVYGDPARLMDALVNGISRRWPPTNDPVLNFLIGALAIIVALIFLPGFLLVGVYLIVVLVIGGIIVLIGAAVVEGLISLARLSLTGAIVAAIIAAFPLVWLIRRVAAPIGRLLRPVGDALFGIFFDWWLYPLWSRLKERRLIADMDKKRAKYETALQALQTDPAFIQLGKEDPQIAGIPLTAGYDNWVAEVHKRWRMGQVKMTLAKLTELLEQLKTYFTQYTAAAEAYDDFRRLPDHLGERREEQKAHAKERREQQELEALRRKKEKEELKAQIQDIKAKQKPSHAAPAPRDPVQEEVDRVTSKIKTDIDLNLAMQRMIAENPEPERVKLIQRAFRKRIERLREEA
jgi:hypothetical protein